MNTAVETKPLENITGIVDSLSRMANALDSFLERFNGQVGADVKIATPPRCYRTEIDRLDATVNRLGSITDLIGRLG